MYSFAKKLFLMSGVVAMLAACSQSHDIDPAKVREVLTEYGNQNPENQVQIQTSYGNITLRLYEDTPLHRANFIRLIKQGFYDNGADFYRVIYAFMVQGGRGAGYDSYLVPPEFTPKHFHKRGALAMAHGDNPENASAPTEFYIVQGQRQDSTELDLTKLTPEQIQTYTTQGGSPNLDGKYTVFGEVTEGMDVVQKIAEVETYSEKPLKRIPLKVVLLP